MPAAMAFLRAGAFGLKRMVRRVACGSAGGCVHEQGRCMFCGRTAA